MEKSSTNTFIAENLRRLREEIAEAALRCGRSPSDVALMAVTKNQPSALVNEAIAAGVRLLGENRAQELMEKYHEYDKAASPEIHFIGHLQTNKVKYIIDKVCLVHSVDSLKLAAEISKAAKKADKTMDILLEINVADEASKYGVSLENSRELAGEIALLDGISLRGLMCVAPFVENTEENRHFFRKMYKKFLDIREFLGHNANMTCLSMGMTHDFETAIEEGSNMVRLGTGIFGERI